MKNIYYEEDDVDFIFATLDVMKEDDGYIR